MTPVSDSTNAPIAEGLTVRQLRRSLFASLTVWLVFVACLHLTFIFRFTTLLGHFPIPMMDDPKGLSIRDSFCDWYIDSVQWRFSPLSFYLTNVLFMGAHIVAQLFIGYRKHRVRFALTFLLFGLFAIFGAQIMFWLED